MTAPSPIQLRYEGDGEFKPVSHYWARRCDREYVCGEEYTLAVHEDRSAKSHRHLFAAIADTHTNLTDEQLERWPTPEHLRKWALIKAGHYDAHSMTATSKAEAMRIAAFLRPVDEFSIVDTQGASVTRYTAKSIAGRALDRKSFQEVKDRVLGVLADLIDVDPAELSKQSHAA